MGNSNGSGKPSNIGFESASPLNHGRGEPESGYDNGVFTPEERIQLESVFSEIAQADPAKAGLSLTLSVQRHYFFAGEIGSMPDIISTAAANVPISRQNAALILTKLSQTLANGSLLSHLITIRMAARFPEELIEYRARGRLAKAAAEVAMAHPELPGKELLEALNRIFGNSPTMPEIGVLASEYPPVTVAQIRQVTAEIALKLNPVADSKSMETALHYADKSLIERARQASNGNAPSATVSLDGKAAQPRIATGIAPADRYRKVPNRRPNAA